MDVEWIATDPQSRRLSFTERRSTAQEYLSRIDALCVLGWGYSEVHLSGRDYPGLALSLQGDYAVLHQFRSEHYVLLLAGDGLIADEETILVPVLDDIDVPFSGAFAVGIERSRAVVTQFVRHGDADSLGDWHEL